MASHCGGEASGSVDTYLSGFDALLSRKAATVVSLILLHHHGLQSRMGHGKGGLE